MVLIVKYYKKLKMELFTVIVGYLAAVFGTALMLPQVYKSIKTKRVDDISMSMLVVYVINCFFVGSIWLVHSCHACNPL